MKIAFVNYNQSTGQYSPEEWVRKIRPYFGVLEQLAHNHEVYYISSFGYSCECTFQKVRCHFKASSNRLISLTRLNSLIQKTAPELVVVYGFHFPFAVHLLSKLVGKNTKIILQSHADKPFTGWRKYFQQYAYKSILFTFFSSEELAKPFTRNGIFSPQQIKEILPASSFLTPVARELAVERTFINGNPAFLWVGRLDKNKDPIMVVECFLQWTEKNPLACLYMIYQTNELITDLIELLTNYPNWTRNIVLVGNVPHHDLASWYSSADFFISGSHAASYGLALCEAMSCGTIPIVTDIPSFRKMTGNGACGILYEAGNKSSLLNALDGTIHLDRCKERTATLNYFKDYISFESIASKFEEMI